MELFDQSRFRRVISPDGACPCCGDRGDLVAYGKIGERDAPTAALLGGRSVASNAPDRVCRSCSVAWLAPLGTGSKRRKRRRFIIFGRLR